MKRSVVFGLVTMALLIFLSVSASGASTRGIRVKAKSRTGAVKEIRLYSDYYALVIGCGAYKSGWPFLPNAAKDAREVAKLLRGKGWKVDLLENPDSRKLRKVLNTLVAKVGRKKDRAVFIWYSGHGYTLQEADGTPLGYIVPVDAPLPDRDLVGFMEKAVNMRYMETVSKGILSRHVLMVFDSCFSGAIFALNRAAPSPYIWEKLVKPVREYITAGSENEVVPDRSVFKECFLRGIGDGDADLNGDGYVTGEELGAYLQEKVVNYSRGAQHPQYGKINNPKLDEGDFVILAGGSVMVEKPSEAQKGLMRIKSDPSGAKVWVNGSYKGTTPLTLTSLSGGSYWVKVKKEGYVSQGKEVKISPGRTVSAIFFLDEVEGKGRLYVETDPRDASVRILNLALRYHDGIKLSPGRYYIEVAKEGYETEFRWIEVSAGEDARVSIILRPATTAQETFRQPGETWREPVTGMEFVWVPGGCYEMGCGGWTSECEKDEKPVHKVCLDGFWIGKYEVTQGQWKKVMGNNPSLFKYGDNYPVERVSWYGAQEYMQSLSRRTGLKFRLPTEAEWEYAARSGGKLEKYAGGSNVNAVAWYRVNSGKHTHSVGTKAPNSLGIYDMSGNVWEWCADWYGKYPSGHVTDPVGPSSGSNRVYRGGSWDFNRSLVRSTHRCAAWPGSRSNDIGFRLVLPQVSR